MDEAAVYGVYGQPAVERVTEMTMDDFIGMSQREQREFISDISIPDLKEAENVRLLKKFIAMKVLMEARCAAEDKSLFNLTAQFRNLLAFCGLRDLHLEADLGNSEDRVLYAGERRVGANGYRLFHVSEMGAHDWERKFFHVDTNNNMDIVTRITRTRPEDGLYYCKQVYIDAEASVIWDLTNSDHLRQLFNEIKKEARYENTLGYDLFCAAAFCAQTLFDLAWESNWAIIAVPAAILLNVAIYAVVIPTTLALSVMEHLVVNPVKWVVNTLADTIITDPLDVFIDEVTSANNMAF